MIMIMCAAVFAWFITTSESQVDKFDAFTVDALNLQVSSDDINYNDNLTVKKDVNLQEVSGLGICNARGVLQLFKPKKDPFTGQPLTDGGRWVLDDAPLVEGEDYCEYSVYIKSTKPVYILLGEDSSIMPAETDIVAYKNKKSEFGDFSIDYIAGAARVAVIECGEDEEGNPTEKMVYFWIPNSTYKLYRENENYMFTINGTREGSYNYYDGSQIQSITEEQDFAWGFLSSSYGLGGNASNVIGTLAAPDENGEYKVHYKIRVWVEGTDREADSVFLGGTFETNLVLYSKRIDDGETSKISG